MPGPTDAPSVLKGDVNLDGDVTLDDANAALKAALGITDLTGDNLTAADSSHNWKMPSEPEGFYNRYFRLPLPEPLHSF